MQNSLTLKRHADLVERMAAALGVDLEEAIMAGTLTPGDLDDAVLTCTGCAAPEACEHWLAACQSDEATPDYCRNKDLLAELRARLKR